MRTIIVCIALVACCGIAGTTIERVTAIVVKGAESRMQLELDAQSRSILEQLRMQLQAEPAAGSGAGPMMAPPVIDEHVGRDEAQ